MTYVAQAHVAYGDMWTAANHNQLLDNTAYLKSQTDLLYVPVNNYSGVAVYATAAVAFDPTYTAGLGIKMSTVAFDPRACGVIVSPSIANGGTGLMAISGIQQIYCVGAVVFGHSLVISPTASAAQDSGGGGWGPGVIGWALAAQAGTGTIPALIKPYPLYYVASQIPAQVVLNDTATHEILNTTTETVGNVVTIPAGLMGATGMVIFEFMGSCSNQSGGNDNYTLRVYFGGTAITLKSSYGIPTNGGSQFHVRLMIKNLTASTQAYYYAVDGDITSSSWTYGRGTLAINTANAVVIQNTHKWDTANVNAISDFWWGRVEYMPSI